MGTSQDTGGLPKSRESANSCRAHEWEKGLKQMARTRQRLGLRQPSAALEQQLDRRFARPFRYWRSFAFISGSFQNNSVPFQFRALEVQDDSAFLAGDAQVNQPPSSLAVP